MYFQANIKQKEDSVLPGFGSGKIQITKKMILKNGTPWIPIMGEMHYSRVPREKWKETLLKMKEGGVDVVASYAFWIHHEETKGIFDFSGNRDIRAFIRLCSSLGLEFCLRIGPWAHGECRNGGFPNWLCEECADSLRSEREPYFSCVKGFINAVAEQIRGLPLFGIQIENEKTNDAPYIERVRRLVIDAGLSAPLYTATGWGRAQLPDTVLPMFGGYPEAPWARHTKELEPNPNYFFSHIREDGCIGADVLGNDSPDGRGKFFTPFLTCELGGGNQVSYHRRPLISSRDIEALAICKLGSGANLLGYYMYTGGLNPIGATTMQESKATGYPNDYPIVSYDFQAPIGDMGQLRESWYRLKYIHKFAHSFGEMLAPMEAVMPGQAPTAKDDFETLRCGLRSDGDGGFLFINNHVRLHEMPAHPSHEFNIDFKDRRVSFSVDVPADSAFFLPVNLTLAGLRILYATAQPVSAEGNRLELLQIPGLAPSVTLNDGRTVALKIGKTSVDGTEILLLPYEEYLPSPLSEIPVTPISGECDTDLLLRHLPLERRGKEYEVTWSEEDRWLVIDAKGNVAGFYAENRLISDYYLYGDRWVIDLRNLPVRRGVIAVQPLLPTEETGIYLEIPFEPSDHLPKAYVCRDPRLFV